MCYIPRPPPTPCMCSDLRVVYRAKERVAMSCYMTVASVARLTNIGSEILKSACTYNVFITHPKSLSRVIESRKMCRVRKGEIRSRIFIKQKERKNFSLQTLNGAEMMKNLTFLLKNSS